MQKPMQQMNAVEASKHNNDKYSILMIQDVSPHKSFCCEYLPKGCKPAYKSPFACIFPSSAVTTYETIKNKVVEA